MIKTNMYNRKSPRDRLAAYCERLFAPAVTAALGAGIITSFAVSQGQHPLVALTITALAVLVALASEYYA